MVDELNAAGQFGGKVAVVQPIKSGLTDLLNEQDGLYTLMMRGVEGGEVKDVRRIVGSVSRGLNPYDKWAEVQAIATSADLRFVISNTTEAGIAYVEDFAPGDACPDNFPAKVAHLLYARYKAFAGAADKGLILIPCELIDRNGDMLKKYVLQHAQAWGLEPEFCAWVENSNYFLNTLVDRIVPGYPRDEVEALCQEFGYEDKLVDTGEIFHLWVIEGPQELAEEIPFHKIGLNVIWTDDMEPYRTRKVRILNGAHTSCVLAGYHCGRETVGEMMDDEVMASFMRKAISEEVLPTMTLPAEELKAYGEAVFERFRNPFVKHMLLSISLNSVSKWKVRVMPSLLDRLAQTGSLPTALTFSLAALIRFYRGERNAEGEMVGGREGNEYTINDNADVLDFFAQVWKAYAADQDCGALVKAVLGNESFWAQDLTAIDGMAAQVTANLEAILASGMKPAIEALLAQEPVA
jgi:tagaturonate reductase